MKLEEFLNELRQGNWTTISEAIKAISIAMPGVSKKVRGIARSQIYFMFEDVRRGCNKPLLHILLQRAIADDGPMGHKAHYALLRNLKFLSAEQKNQYKLLLIKCYSNKTPCEPILWPLLEGWIDRHNDGEAPAQEEELLLQGAEEEISGSTTFRIGNGTIVINNVSLDELLSKLAEMVSTIVSNLPRLQLAIPPLPAVQPEQPDFPIESYVTNLGPNEYTVSGALHHLGYGDLSVGTRQSVQQIYATIRSNTSAGMPKQACQQGRPLGIPRTNGSESPINIVKLPRDLPFLLAAVVISAENGYFDNVTSSANQHAAALVEWDKAAKKNEDLKKYAFEVTCHMYKERGGKAWSIHAYTR